MPRSRLVHHTARAADQAPIVSVPLEPATPIDGKTCLCDSTASLPIERRTRQSS